MTWVVEVENRHGGSGRVRTLSEWEEKNYPVSPSGSHVMAGSYGTRAEAEAVLEQVLLEDLTDGYDSWEC